MVLFAVGMTEGSAGQRFVWNDRVCRENALL